MTVFSTFVMQVLLPMMIYTAGPISGAHFNPMVTSVFVMAKMQVSCLCVHCVSLHATSAGLSWLLLNGYGSECLSRSLAVIRTFQKLDCIVHADIACMQACQGAAWLVCRA